MDVDVETCKKELFADVETRTKSSVGVEKISKASVALGGGGRGGGDGDDKGDTSEKCVMFGVAFFLH